MAAAGDDTAVAAGETDGLLPISDKQPTPPPTTTTKTKTAAAETAGEAFAVFLMLALLVVAALVGVAYLSIGAVHLLGRWGTELSRPYDPVEYTVTIAAVSGLDPAKDDLHHRPAPSSSLFLVDTVFNLTLGVSSPRTAARRECVEAGTAVEVSYSYNLRRRSAAVVRLASGTVPAALCVEVGEEEEGVVVVAWGDGVRLPGFVADTLAEDVHVGGKKPEFGVRLTPPIPYCTGVCSTTVHVMSCPAAKVGGGPAPCRVLKETVNFPPPPRPGRER